VRRALLGDGPVEDDLGAPREPLLEDGLVVHRVLERLLDLAAERLHDRRRGPLQAERKVGGADDRLADRGEHALGVHEHVGGPAGALGRGGAQLLGHPERAGDARARGAAHGLGAHLGEPPRAVALEAREQVVRHCEAQDHVPQEREPLVRLGAVLDPGRVPEDLPPQVVRQLVE
jgi:hypothetical protein